MARLMHETTTWLQQQVAELVDPHCWEAKQPILTNNMCRRREDSLKTAAAILALIKELV